MFSKVLMMPVLLMANYMALKYSFMILDSTTQVLTVKNPKTFCFWTDSSPFCVYYESVFDAASNMLRLLEEARHNLSSIDKIEFAVWLVSQYCKRSTGLFKLSLSQLPEFSHCDSSVYRETLKYTIQMTICVIWQVYCCDVSVPKHLTNICCIATSFMASIIHFVLQFATTFIKGQLILYNLYSLALAVTTSDLIPPKPLTPKESLCMLHNVCRALILTGQSFFTSCAVGAYAVAHTCAIHCSKIMGGGQLDSLSPCITEIARFLGLTNDNIVQMKRQLPVLCSFVTQVLQRPILPKLAAVFCQLYKTCSTSVGDSDNSIRMRTEIRVWLSLSIEFVVCRMIADMNFNQSGGQDLPYYLAFVIEMLTNIYKAEVPQKLLSSFHKSELCSVIFTTRSLCGHGITLERIVFSLSPIKQPADVNFSDTPSTFSSSDSSQYTVSRLRRAVTYRNLTTDTEEDFVVEKHQDYLQMASSTIEAVKNTLNKVRRADAFLSAGDDTYVAQENIKKAISLKNPIRSVVLFCYHSALQRSDNLQFGHYFSYTNRCNTIGTNHTLLDYEKHSDIGEEAKDGNFMMSKDSMPINSRQTAMKFFCSCLRGFPSPDGHSSPDLLKEIYLAFYTITSGTFQNVDVLYEKYRAQIDSSSRTRTGKSVGQCEEYLDNTTKMLEEHSIGYQPAADIDLQILSNLYQSIDDIMEIITKYAGEHYRLLQYARNFQAFVSHATASSPNYQYKCCKKSLISWGIWSAKEFDLDIALVEGLDSQCNAKAITQGPRRSVIDYFSWTHNDEDAHCYPIESLSA